MTFDERFRGPDLDPAIWTPSYLPAWSPRAAAAATSVLGFTPQYGRIEVTCRARLATMQSRAYPLMLILGVFDFPDREPPGGDGTAPPRTPELTVSRVRWTPL